MSGAARYADHLDYYRRGPRASEVRGRRLVGTARLHLFDVVHAPGEISGSGVAEFLLVVGRRGCGDLAFDLGAGTWCGRWRPGCIVVAPAETPTRYRPEAACRYLTVAFPSGAARSVLAEARPGGRADFGRLHAAPFRDPFVEALCGRLWDEAAAGDPCGSLFADGAAVALAAALGRLSEGGRPARALAKGGLAPFALRRALEFMDANLAGDPSLADLAASAGLSPFHFARAFRQATGTSPHRRLQERRVERARELLASTGLPLAEVALAVGFKSQEHFTAVFRRFAGTTPGRYRGSARL